MNTWHQITKLWNIYLYTFVGNYTSKYIQSVFPSASQAFRNIVLITELTGFCSQQL